MNKIKVAMSGLSWASGDVPGGLGNYPGEQIIDEIALAGFDGAEAGMGFPRDPQELKEMLDLRGLVIPSGWYGSEILTKPCEWVEEDFALACERMKVTGGNIMNVCEQGYTVQGAADTDVNARHIMNDAEWDRLVTGLKRLTEVASAHGCVIAYHHHMGTVVQSSDDVNKLMDMMKGTEFGLLIDTGHAVFAGIDPVGLYNKYHTKVKNVHLKDVRYGILRDCLECKDSFPNAIVKGAFGCPGDGDYGFPQFFKALNAHGYEGWVVVEAEQDPSVYHPFTCAKRTREYIKKELGA